MVWLFMIQKQVSKFTYSLDLGIFITIKVLEGDTIQKIARLIGIPAKKIYLWQRKHPQFEENIKDARSERKWEKRLSKIECR